MKCTKKKSYQNIKYWGFWKGVTKRHLWVKGFPSPPRPFSSSRFRGANGSRVWLFHLLRKLKPTLSHRILCDFDDFKLFFIKMDWRDYIVKMVEPYPVLVVPYVFPFNPIMSIIPLVKKLNGNTWLRAIDIGNKGTPGGYYAYHILDYMCPTFVDACVILRKGCRICKGILCGLHLGNPHEYLWCTC